MSVNLNINKKIVGGRLADDAKISTIGANDTVVARFRVITSSDYKNKEGQWIKRPMGHNVVIFGVSDYVKNNLVKGAAVYVEGEDTETTYEGNGGETKYFKEVKAQKVQIVYSPNVPASSDSSSEDAPSSPEDDDTPF